MFRKLLILCLLVFSIQVFSAQIQNPRAQRPNDNTAALLKQCVAEKNQLQEQKGALETRVNNLQARIAELNQLPETLKAKEAEIKNLNAQITTLNSEKNDLNQKLSTANRSLTTLSQENQNLKSQLDTANQNLAGLSKENAEVKQKVEAANQNIAELSKQAAVTAESMRKAPERFIASLQETQKQLDQSRQAEVIELPNEGVRVIRELVIGTLELFYEKKVKAESPTTLKAVFKAHPLLNPQKGDANTEPMSWHIKLDYTSPTGKVAYDKGASGGQEQDREVNPYGGQETWSWNITFPANFQNEKQDVYVFVSYQAVKDGDKPIASQSVSFEVETLVAETWNKIKENLSYILGLLAIILGLWGTWVTIKKTRVETKLAELQLNPPQ